MSDHQEGREGMLVQTGRVGLPALDAHVTVSRLFATAARRGRVESTTGLPAWHARVVRLDGDTNGP